MTDVADDSIVGRHEEMASLEAFVISERKTLVIVSGPSGIGKTKLVETFCESSSVTAAFRQVIFLTIYRTNWTNAISQLKRFLRDVPANATLAELEDAIINLAARSPILLILDNVDTTNVTDVQAFAARWISSNPPSALILTAQDDVRAVLPSAWTSIDLSGLTADADILTLLGGLRATLPVDELLRVGEALQGNPQLLLFLRWLEPHSVSALQESTAKLAEQRTADAVEDLVGQSSLSTLFFLALGLHKDLDITDELLANLWDHFGSRGAEPFVRAIDMLTRQGFLTPTRPGHYRLHESVHVSLPKALRDRIGEDRIPSLHHYFAEYYRRSLYSRPSNTALAHFVYHARLAGDYRLTFDTLIARGVATQLASVGTALQVLAELEVFERSLPPGFLAPVEYAQLYVALGRLCNDLSEHPQALGHMDACSRHMEAITDPAVHGRLSREVWYISAVAYSNTGQSDYCLQNYFRIVASCAMDADQLACLSAGYLAHDLKYRDLEGAYRLGEISVRWAESFDSGIVLAKNLCSFAETVAVYSGHAAAKPVFQRAAAIAKSFENRRELARIMTNWGFSDAIADPASGFSMIEKGTEYSRSLGDRRRHLQGLLYGGVCQSMAGERVRGRAAIYRSAVGFQSLDDGRYFVLALCWLLQLDGAEPAEGWPLGEELGVRQDVAELGTYALGHPEFEVYYAFWRTRLSHLLGGHS